MGTDQGQVGLVPNFFSVDLYAFGGHVPHLLWLLHPGVVLLGSDAWNDALAVYNACGTRPWLILRWMDLDVTRHTPEEAADFICTKAVQLRAHGIKAIAHGLNEQYTNRPRARAWELRFIARCHDRWGIETLCSNYPFANFDNDEAQSFVDVWRESDWNGPHLYDLYTSGQFEPRLETSLRYRRWKNYPIEKMICTEFGVEDGGWEKLGLTTVQMQERMLENVEMWAGDGMRAAGFFCMDHIDDIKWGPYYGVESMYKFWGGNSPPFQSGGIVPVPKELDEAQALCKDGQVIFGRSVTEIWEKKGESVAQLFKKFGDIYNKIEDAKKALSPAPLLTIESQSLTASGLTPHSPQNLGGPGHPEP